MITLILKSLYFFLPAYLANMAPFFIKYINKWKKPVSSKYFGKNKTWIGILFAVIVGFVVFLLQQVFYLKAINLSLIDYQDFPFYFGAVLGLGAIVGDLIESYYKRQAKIAPGEPWMLWDQLDFVFGGIIASSLFYVPAIEVVVVLLIVSPVLHVLTNFIGYTLGLKKNKF